MSKKMSVFRDLTTSLVIGWLSTYLPIWEISKEMDKIFIGFAVAFLVFYAMFATNKDI